MNTLYIVASSAQQRAGRLPAAQLYVGDLFSASITHARCFARSESGVLILSRHLGLLSQGYLVQPYDTDSVEPLSSAHLVATIRRELPHLKTLPLRLVVLAPAGSVAVFREALIGTPFEPVPLRIPLANQSHAEQLHWLRAATWAIECDAPLPALSNLSAAENEQLNAAVRAAATWISANLMLASPPPENSLFANALALQLHRNWSEVAAASRGEWPEDIGFSVAFPGGGTLIEAALQDIGLAPRDWWKREGRVKPPQLSMQFSLACVTGEYNGHIALIFQ